MPSRRSRIIIAVAAIALVAVAAWVLLAPRLGLQPASVAPSWSPPVPRPPAAERVGPASGWVDADWLESTAAATDIPIRALAAYAGVSVFQVDFRPECGLSWTILAAVGYVESRHGTHDGSSVQDDGTVVPPIYGVPLAGGETDRITDTDAGAFDGDTEFDRAMGPLQMIPEAWRNWGYDGNFDGLVDPQNIDDASHAAANYLCRASAAGLDVEEGWRAGIAAYNSDPAYIDAVATAAERYREAVGG